MVNTASFDFVLDYIHLFPSKIPQDEWPGLSISLALAHLNKANWMIGSNLIIHACMLTISCCQ